MSGFTRDRKSVSRLSRDAASRIGDIPNSSKRNILKGNLYHSGERGSWVFRCRYFLLSIDFVFIIFGLLKTGFLFRSVLVAAFIFLSYLVLYIYWSKKDILSGLPGKVFYDDATREGKRSYLHDSELGLHGSPDYIMEHNGKYYVVEYKTRPYGLPEKPNYKHLTQLVAYHLILERIYPQKMLDFGYLIYQSRCSNRVRSFRYKIDDFMRQEVLRNLS